MSRGSVRREVRVRCHPDEIWRWISDPGTIQQWFPGIVDSTVDGDVRVITTGAGMPMPERILTNDPLLRRFQYRLEAPVFTEHTSTIDVHDLGDGTCLVVYSVDADPAPMALVIGGAAADALASLGARIERAHTSTGSAAVQPEGASDGA